MENVETRTVRRESTREKIKCNVWRRRTLREKYIIIVCFLMSVAVLVMTGLLLHLIYSSSQSSTPVCYSSLCKSEAGRIITSMDLSADPCEDFYTFSCGSYIKNHNLPNIGERTSIDYFVQENLWKLSKELIETADENVEPEFMKKVKMFYNSCIKADISTSELIRDLLSKTQLNVWPIVKEGAIDLDKILAIIEVYLRNPFFYIQLGGNITSEVVKVIAMGSTLVSNEILLNTTEEKYIKKKKEYKKLLLYTLFKANFTSSIIEEEADRLIELETKIAEVNQNYSYEQDPNKINSTLNKYLSECKRISVLGILNNIYELLDRAEILSGDTPITVYYSEQLESMCEMLQTIDQRTIYNYLVWYFLASNLHNFDPYFEKKFHDIEEDKDYIPAEKWKDCIYSMNFNSFEPGISYLVLRHLQTEESFEEVRNYVFEIKDAMENMFLEESWIDPISKNFSINKIWNINAEIGYSSGSLDVDLLEGHFNMIETSDDYLENKLQLAKWQTRTMILNDTSALYNSITIRRPLLSNGYFTGDSFVLKLGLLVPPYFIPKGSKFLNYAVTGFVIAHELTHAFDSIDETAAENGTEMWTNETIQRFIEKKQCYVDQYSKYPFDDNDKTVNGSNTFGDNISDNSGLIQSYAAYEKYLKANGEEPRLPGLDYTNQQMFFITYAQQWCEVVKSQIEVYKYDVHSPARYRVIGPLQNFRKFSEAFKCPVDSPMNPSLKCRMYG